MTDSLVGLRGSYERGMDIETNSAFLNLVQGKQVSCSHSCLLWQTVYLRAEACWWNIGTGVPQTGEEEHRSTIATLLILFHPFI